MGQDVRNMPFQRKAETTPETSPVMQSQATPAPRTITRTVLLVEPVWDSRT